MDEEKPYFFRQALSDALIFAIVLIIFSLIEWSTITFGKSGIYGLALVGFMVMIMIPVMLVIFTKRYRNRYLDGIINFRTAFNYSMLIVVISSITMMMYDYVFLTYIDSNYLERTKEIFDSKIPEMISEQILTVEGAEKLKAMIPEEIPSASESAKGSGVYSMLLGVIASLISGVICVKKIKPESFKETY